MEPIQELISRGKQHFENREYDPAEQYFRQVLKMGQGFADIFHMMGVISHSKGQFDTAIDFFKKALNINPNYTEAILNLAVLYNDLGEYKEAKKLYSHLQKNGKGQKNKGIEPVLKGKLSNLHATTGDIYRSIGLYSFAAQEYQKALDLNPGYVDIRIKLGVSLREDGNLEESMKEFKTALKTDPKNITAHIQLGITNYSRGKTVDAKKEWETALKTDSKNESAKMYLRLCDTTKPTQARAS